METLDKFIEDTNARSGNMRGVRDRIQAPQWVEVQEATEQGGELNEGVHWPDWLLIKKGLDTLIPDNPDSSDVVYNLIGEKGILRDDEHGQPTGTMRMFKRISKTAALKRKIGDAADGVDTRAVYDNSAAIVGDVQLQVDGDGNVKHATSGQALKFRNSDESSDWATTIAPAHLGPPDSASSSSSREKRKKKEKKKKTKKNLKKGTGKKASSKRSAAAAKATAAATAPGKNNLKTGSFAKGQAASKAFLGAAAEASVKLPPTHQFRQIKVLEKTISEVRQTVESCSSEDTIMAVLPGHVNQALFKLQARLGLTPRENDGAEATPAATPTKNPQQTVRMLTLPQHCKDAGGGMIDLKKRGEDSVREARALMDSLEGCWTSLKAYLARARSSPHPHT